MNIFRHAAAAAALAACCCPFSAWGAGSITLYEEGARVVESRGADAAGGLAVFILPKSADENSIRVSASGCTVSSLEVRPAHVPAAPDSLPGRLKAARAEAGLLERNVKGLEARLAALRSPASSISQAEELGRMDDLRASRDAELCRELAGLEQKLALQKKEVERLSALVKRGGWSEDALEVRCMFLDKAGKPCDGRVDAVLGYALSGCGWTPRIDLQADTKAGLVLAARSAVLSQGTGMDWDGFDLVLAQGMPSDRMAPRSLPAWRIRPVADAPAAANAGARMAAAPAMLMEARMEDAAAPAKAAPRRVETASAQMWRLGVRTVKAGGGIALALDSNVWKADFYRLVRPKVGESAWLAADVVLPAGAGISRGEARFTVDGADAGTGEFSFSGTKGTVYFGIDPWVTAVMKNEVLQSGEEGFIGKRNTYEWKWRIRVKNSHAFPVRVRVEDSLPEPGDRRIAVARTSDPEPEVAGKCLAWNLEVAPGEREIIHGVRIEAPGDMKLSRGR